jgi:hypothetical protein
VVEVNGFACAALQQQGITEVKTQQQGKNAS